MASIIKTLILAASLTLISACTTLTERSDSPDQAADNRIDEEIDRQISQAQRDEKRAKRLLLIILEELRN